MSSDGRGNGEAVAVPVGTEIAEGVKFNNDDRRTVFNRTLAFFDRLVLDAHDERLAHPVGVGRAARPPKDVRGITCGCAHDAQLSARGWT